MSGSDPTATDANRLTRWVRDHGSAVARFLRLMVRDAALADDLAQEVFCRAWEARGRYADQGKERAYLLRIADRLARARLRLSGREVQADLGKWRQLEPALSDASPLDALARDEAAAQLSAALASLSEAQRRTLLLRYFGGLRFTEIAEQTGSPLGTVLSHFRRGLAALRRQFVEDVL